MTESHGLTISRRRIIGAGTGLALVGLLSPSSWLAQEQQAQASSSWTEFLATARERGKKLLADPTTTVDEYLFLLASLASRIDTVPRTDVQAVPWAEPAVKFGMASRGAPFVVIEWQLAPGATLPPHNHPNASVCTIGLEGSAEIDNYEIVGDAPKYDSSASFQVRRTHHQLLLPRRVNTVAPHRDNIHTLRAGSSGARGIDLTSLHGANAPFSYLRIQGKGDLASARWYKPA